MPEDASGVFAAALVASRPAVLATVAEFARELSVPLPGTLYVSSWSPLLKEGTLRPYVTLESVSNKSTERISLLLERAWWYTFNDSGTEEVVASTADLLTGNVLAALDVLTGALNLRANRNATDPSGATLERLRPDWWALDGSGALLVKAEHKRRDDELGEAMQDLVEKMSVWNPVALRGLPFLPCYAVGGRWLVFCAVYQRYDSIVVEKVSAVYNMTVSAHRVLIVIHAFNLYKCMISLRSVMPQHVPSLYVDQVRTRGTIRVLDDHVLKKCVPADDDVYVAVASLPFAVTISRVPNGEEAKCASGCVQLKITPVCLERLPLNETELKTAIKCVLSALAVFHEGDFVHRDIRWPNLLYDMGASGRSRWLLADFELAGKIGSELPVEYRTSLEMPPEARIGSALSAAADVWQVGMLVKVWKIGILSELAEGFVHNLTCYNARERPSAREALAHRWLAVA